MHAKCMSSFLKSIVVSIQSGETNCLFYEAMYCYKYQGWSQWTQPFWAITILSSFYDIVI
jgi:hypothetical protein